METNIDKKDIKENHQSKMYSRDEMVQQMNNILNDLLCKSYTNTVKDLLKYPNSNKIGEFINNWSKDNL